MASDRNPSNHINAVIFDYGEVLCHKPTSEQTARLAGFFGVDLGRFPALWERNRGPFDRGDLTPKQYWSMLAEDAGVRISAEQLAEITELDVAMWSNVDPSMVAWADQIRSYGLKVGLLSNMHHEMVTYCRNHFAWLKNFDFVTFSAEVNLIKPDPAIYQHTLNGLNVPAAETLFLDDRAVNVQAARALGIRAIQFQTMSQCRSELQAMGFAVPPSEPLD
jgi:putative hydrolase of the HAD superfamily